MSKKDSEERRRHSRLSVPFKAKLKLPHDIVLSGQTRNISFGGAFVELEAVPPLKKGDYVSLVLLSRVEFTCKLIHSNMRGIGFEFDFILIKYYEVFKEMMLHNAPDRDRMIKELGRWTE
nr:PilZ domain-containing protein [Desulfobulbaceae bacterium]